MEIEELFTWIVSHWGVITAVISIASFLYAGSAAESKVKKDNRRCESFVDSSVADGFHEGPTRASSDPKNAARCAVLSLAAYGDEQLKKKIVSGIDGGAILIPWRNYNADGIILVDGMNKAITIAIAGTNDKNDFLNDGDVLYQSLSDWSAANDVPIAEDASRMEVRSTSGFLAYTALAYRGVMRELADRNIELANYPSIFITGHSLGGAAATLLQLTQPFGTSKAYTFGAPKPYRLLTKRPIRRGLRIVSIFDAIAHVPPQCKHPQFETIFLINRSTRRTTIPLLYLPVYMLVGLFGMLGKWTRRRSGHSMKVYARNLIGLGV